MKACFLLVAVLLWSVASYGQGKVLDIPELLQLVSYSKSEHSLQTDARNKQAAVTASEAANKTLLAQVKDQYRTLQSRYSALGTVIGAVDIGIQAEPMVRHIIASQALLLRLAQKNPVILPLAYRTEIDFAEKSELLIRYLAGLVLSMGDLNQMKASDRKLLFDYVISELSHIEDMGDRLVRSVQFGSWSALLQSADPFASFVSQDQSLVKDILSNAKYLNR